MEAVITGFVVVIALSVLLFGLYKLQERSHDKAVESKAVVQQIVANQDRIKELEEDIFGVGIDIKGLPGAFWLVERGFDWVQRKDYKDINRRDEDGLIVQLMDADSNNMDSQKIFSMGRRQVGYDMISIKRTPEEMEQEIQKAMKNMVDKEIKRQKYEAGMNDIIEKYNKKMVVQDEV